MGEEAVSCSGEGRAGEGDSDGGSCSPRWGCETNQAEKEQIKI